MLRSVQQRARNYFFKNFALPRKMEEKISKKYIGEFIPQNAFIVDCGAHDGSDSIELAQIPGARIFSFEPVPAVFSRLKERTKFNPAIQCFQLALADKNGKVTFHVSAGTSDGSSSILPPKEHLLDHPSVSFPGSIEVNCRTLDTWAEENMIAKIDLLWLDMQGYELPMLKASPKMLSTVSAIHTEVSVKETYSGVAVYDEVKAWLEGEGFTVQLEAIPANWDMGNVLFVRKRHGNN
jgi:FkbM family methyltransferase